MTSPAPTNRFVGEGEIGVSHVTVLAARIRDGTTPILN